MKFKFKQVSLRSYSIRSISRKSSAKFSKAATKYKLIPKKPASATKRNAAFNWMFNAEYRNSMIYSGIDSSRNKYLNQNTYLIHFHLSVATGRHLHHLTWISKMILSPKNAIQHRQQRSQRYRLGRHQHKHSIQSRIITFDFIVLFILFWRWLFLNWNISYGFNFPYLIFCPLFG